MSKPTGGPAFPVSNDADKEYNWIKQGMTLRDYFAGCALQGIMARCGDEVGPEHVSQVCRIVYKVADAMLEARDLT